MAFQRILVTILLLIISCTAFANEANNRFGERSWQFDTPSDKVAKQNSLVLYCQQNPKNCNMQSTTPTDNSRTITPPNNGGQSGTGLNLGGGDGIIGNNITIVIEGDGNVVEVSGDQSLNDSPQTINHTVSDNNVTIVDSDNVPQPQPSDQTPSETSN